MVSQNAQRESGWHTDPEEKWKSVQRVSESAVGRGTCTHRYVQIGVQPERGRGTPPSMVGGQRWKPESIEKNYFSFFLKDRIFNNDDASIASLYSCIISKSVNQALY